MADDLSLVITPPYDVITPEEKIEMAERHPHCIIKIDYGVDVPGDDKYERAAKLLGEWTESGVLVQDEKPAIYISEMEFLNMEGEVRIRHGFISLLRTEDFGKGYIFPHERTFPKHKVDRLNLIRAAHAQFNPIFVLYADRKEEVISLLDARAKASAPDVEFRSDDGTIQRMWRIDDADGIESIIGLMKNRPVYIADGHHRYDTSRNFLRETEERLGTLPEDHPARFCLCYFDAMEDKGIELTSPQRLLNGLPDFSPEKVFSTLSAKFDIEKADKSIVDEIIHADGDRHIFGLQFGSEFYRMKLKASAENTLPADEPTIYNKLDTSICTYHILHELVGGPEKILDHVRYEVDYKNALKLVESGEYQMGVWISPTRMKHITEVVEQKEVFPQKTTYFYPKLVTGLVIYRLNME